MRINSSLATACFIILFFSSFCLATDKGISKTERETVRAIASQAVDKNTGTTLISAAVSGTPGYIVGGNEMDKYDQQQLTKAYETAPSGQAVSWTNPDNHNQYQVIPQPAYTVLGNQTCRKAEIVAVIDGKTERTYSTACRDAYGSWQLQN